VAQAQLNAANIVNAAMLPRAMSGFAFLHAKVRFLGKKWHVTARPKSRAMQETSRKPPRNDSIDKLPSNQVT